MYQKEINEKWQRIHEFKSLLKRTDYQVIKEAEGGYAVPEEIKEQRQYARAQINSLEKEIEGLELLQEEIVQSETDLDF